MLDLIRRRPREVGILAALALAVRVAYVLGTSPRRLPFTDSLYYQLQASVLTKGHGFVQPLVFTFQGRSVATAAHPPLYPLLLAAGDLLGAQSVLAHQVMGCLIGTGTAVGAGLIGAHVAGERAGLLAIALAAVYPPLWVADGGIMSEGLFALITVAVVLGSYRLLERRTVADAAWLGGAVGLAMLTRAEAVLLLAVLVIPLVVMARTGARRAVELLATAAAVSVLLVSPWVARNLLTFHHPVTLSTGDGTLLGANCPPAFYGPGIGTWYLSCYSVITTRPGDDESDGTSAARRAGLRYIEAHPSRVPVVVAARIARIWQLYQPVADGNNDLDDGRPRWANTAALVGYALIVPFAVAGEVVLLRRSRRTFPLMAQLLGVTVTAALVWGAVRFRAPAEVVLVVLGGVALDALWSRRAGRDAAREAPRLAGPTTVESSLP